MTHANGTFQSHQMPTTGPPDRVTRVGIIGCGNVFDGYVAGLRLLEDVAIEWCADLDPDYAAARAAEEGIPRHGLVDQLLFDASDPVDLVVNITPPAAHEGVAIAALRANKHVYTEKPLALSRDAGRRMLSAAEDCGQLLGCAPDTFLGSAGQTARAAVDSGEIGEIIGASAFVTHHRIEEWHPDPTAFFVAGGGPLKDLGPYYITALVNCLGPIDLVAGAARIGGARRHVTTPERSVEHIDVSVATHASAILTFHSGAIATTLMSFDIWHRTLPFIELYGTKGILSLPDPNDFDGDVRIRQRHDEEWKIIPPVGAVGGLRGLGVRDMIGAFGGEPQRASAPFAYHVLDVLCAIEEAGEAGAVIAVESCVDRPAPVART